MPVKKVINYIQTKWDILAGRFNTHLPLNRIHPEAAVNIYVGWPVLFEQVKYQCEAIDKKYCNILDFGCGSGDFCVKLNSQGHYVKGVDASHEMIELARKYSPTDIEYILGDCTKNKELLSSLKNKMDIITSIHAFDWIEDVESLSHQLVSLLANKGVLLFCVFPKKHVADCIAIHDLFENFDSNTDPFKGVCNFDGVKIPVYVRDAVYYDKLFSNLNCEKVLEYYPPYPASFLKKYLWTGSLYPEMMILGYRKNSK